MHIGALRTQLTLQRPPSGIDAEGQPSGAWAVVSSVWAGVRYPSGMASIKADADVSVAKVSIRIRWRADVQPGWRLVFGSTTTYLIDAVLPDAGRQFVDLACHVVR